MGSGVKWGGHVCSGGVLCVAGGGVLCVVVGVWSAVVGVLCVLSGPVHVRAYTSELLCTYVNVLLKRITSNFAAFVP